MEELQYRIQLLNPITNRWTNVEIINDSMEALRMFRLYQKGGKNKYRLLEVRTLVVETGSNSCK